MLVILKDVAVAVFIPAIRPVSGLLVNALKDGKVTRIEWKGIISKTVKVMTISICAYYGFSFAGVDIPLVATGFAAIGFDKLLDSLKETKSIRK